MRTRILLLVALAATAAAAAATAASVPAAKTATPGARLLLPFYLVDTTAGPAGATTFFAVRNESTASVEVRISYYETDAPQTPQRQDTILLGPKEIETIDVRAVANLEIDPDGFARGYALIEAPGGEGVLHGDYFQINGAEAFASGARLLNVDPASTDNDLCSRFSMRFLDSALLFDSGTVYTIWVDADEPPAGTVFAYSVYGEAGGEALLSSTLEADQVAFQVSASDLRLIVQEEFGAIEFEFVPPLVGHVSAVLSARGTFSVGLEATCLD